MLRQSVRVRKEYLFKKAVAAREAKIQERKDIVKRAIAEDRPLPTELRKKGQDRKVHAVIDLDDVTTADAIANLDDEYANAGTYVPRVAVSTSRQPSARLIKFVKELTLVFPNANAFRRGQTNMPDLVRACQSSGVTDLVIVHEHKGTPDGLIVCHLPSGPSTYFTLSDVTLRADLDEKPPHMSQAAPHLVFNNFSTPLGLRIRAVLRCMYPPASPTTARVQCFHNRLDRIHFRHYIFDRKSGREDDPEAVELNEEGPRFTLKPYRIELGTVDVKDADVEWALRAFINKAKPLLDA